VGVSIFTVEPLRFQEIREFLILAISGNTVPVDSFQHALSTKL